MMKRRRRGAARLSTAAITASPHGGETSNTSPFPLSRSYIICCQVTVALQSPRRLISSRLSSTSTTENLCGRRHTSLASVIVYGECECHDLPRWRLHSKGSHDTLHTWHTGILTTALSWICHPGFIHFGFYIFALLFSVPQPSLCFSASPPEDSAPLWQTAARPAGPHACMHEGLLRFVSVEKLISLPSLSHQMDYFSPV